MSALARSPFQERVADSPVLALYKSVNARFDGVWLMKAAILLMNIDVVFEEAIAATKISQSTE